MVVGIEISKIEIPEFVKKLPDNIEQQLTGKQGGYRLQRSIAENLKKRWKILVPFYFHVRKDYHLPVSNKFRDAYKYSVTKDGVTLGIKPCLGKDGFNYVHSLVHGRRGIEGKHYVSFEDVDCLMPRGSVKSTTSKPFDNLVEGLKLEFKNYIGTWSKTMLGRAIKAAGGK